LILGQISERYPIFPVFSRFVFFPFPIFMKMGNFPIYFSHVHVNFSHVVFLSFGALSQAMHGPAPKRSEGTFLPKNNF